MPVIRNKCIRTLYINVNKKISNLDAFELDERKFIKIMAGQSLSGEVGSPKQVVELTNLHDQSYLEKGWVHPLTYFPDFKKHPDLVAVPTGYKYSWNIEERYNEIKKIG
jgi:hypothetical protein